MISVESIGSEEQEMIMKAEYIKRVNGIEHA